MWYTRSGEKVALNKTLNNGHKRFLSDVTVVDEDRGTINVQNSCARCGDAGGCQKWDHTGHTCYQCGGSGLGPVKTVKVYSKPYLDVLNGRLAARRKKEQEKRAVEHMARCQESLTLNLMKHPEAMARLSEYQGDNSFLEQMKPATVGQFELTDGQAEAIIKAIDRENEREEFNNRIAELEANAMPAPVGCVDIEGILLTVKMKETRYGVTRKMLVIDNRGFKVWVSAPSEILGQMKTGEDDMPLYSSVRGRLVSFKATLKPGDNDPCFAFGSRPVNFKYR